MGGIRDLIPEQAKPGHGTRILAMSWAICGIKAGRGSWLLGELQERGRGLLSGFPLFA